MFMFLFSPFFMFGLLLASLVIAVIMGLMTLMADKIIRGPPKSLVGLKTSMAATGAAVLLGSIAVLYALLWYTHAASYWFYGVIVFVAIFMVLQWLFSPWIIRGVYRTREPGPSESWLAVKLDKLASAAGLSRKPKLLIADVDAPNAFAFGSPITGNYVAVTRGLLEIMPENEVEAVIGHELGHLRHRDVTIILALSLIPVALFYLGRTLLMWGWLAGGDDNRNGGILYYIGLGIALVAVGFIFQFLVSHFNRLREYYADSFSAKITGWPSNLQRALARLTLSYKVNPQVSAQLNRTAAMLFIVNALIDTYGHMAFDPTEFFWVPRRPRRINVDIDEAVKELMKQKESSVLELFSSHPPVSKRLRFLEELKKSLGFDIKVE